ncbi:uncharacterized protein LOC110869455 isoform X4 [Helianthus annuus]|uniref:uncharacterized protein LOC110869455 isoform X4 n=1 Tax=Helianthus annuus TaxID=4232 RepID=UPI000B8F7433|nr:uncharacterized protein LOC110869455 isoform X4 [Helianthus annuus]
MESVLSFYLPPCLILLSQHPNADLDSGNCCFMLTTISIDRGINRVAFSVIFSYLGLLTMDLRFGDVIDDAARYFKDAYNRESSRTIGTSSMISPVSDPSRSPLLKPCTSTSTQDK